MKREKLFFNITLFALVLVLVCIFSSVIVHSAQAENKAVMDEYYLNLENEFKAQVRDYANSNGFRNAGITVTRIVNAEGERSYTVKIHHAKLELLEDEELNTVLDEICSLGFEDDLCSFRAQVVR